MAISGILLSASWLQNVSTCKEGSALADFLYFLRKVWTRIFLT